MFDESVLPVHPVTGETALGFTSRGPVWPVVGASDDDSNEGDESGAGSDSSDAEGDDSGDDGQSGENQLGDAGKRALDNMKGKYKSERDKRRAVEDELDKLRSAGQSGDGNDADQVRQEAEKAATQKANARIVRSEVRAAAAGKLSDPADASRFLDLDQFEVGADGDVDEDEVAEAITDLVKNKPYLSAKGGHRFEGSAEGGARKGSTQPQQLTADDVKNMTREQINKARKEGRLDKALGKNS